MMSLEIYINDKKVNTLGLKTAGNVGAMLTLTREESGKEDVEVDFDGLNVFEDGAMELTNWEGKELKLGDSITIKVSNNQVIDEPKEVISYNDEVQDENDYQYYLKLKERFKSVS